MVEKLLLRENCLSDERDIWISFGVVPSRARRGRDTFAQSRDQIQRLRPFHLVEICNNDIEVKQQGHRLRGAGMHQALKVSATAIRDGVNRFLGKTIAGNALPSDISLFAQLEYLAIDRGSADLRPTRKMMIIDILLQVVSALRFFRKHSEDDQID